MADLIWFLGIALSLSLALNAGLLWRAREWSAYHKAVAAKKSTEVQDALKEARKAGMDVDRVTLVKDGQVVHVGANVSERTRNRMNAPSPAVMRNAR
jgi:hypothetical protein